MKIIHVETGQHLYGGAKQVAFLMQGLAEQGVTNILCCPKGAEIEAAGRSADAVIASTPSAGDLDFPFLLQMRRIIRQHKPDLVHLHSRRGADTLGGIAARLEKVPVVLSRRVDNPEPDWLFRLKYRLYDHVIAISEGIKRVLLAEGLDPAKLTCVHSAVEAKLYQSPATKEEFLTTFSLTKEHRVIGIVAQLIPRKGHRYLLNVLPKIVYACPNARVIVFGQGPLLKTLQQQVTIKGLTDHVQFAGFREDLEQWLAHLDILVHPADTEGLGVSLLQAAAAGVPIVASRTGGIPEIVRHSQNGLLITPGDEQALADSILDLLRSKTLRSRFGEAGKRIVENEFSIKNMVDGNLAVYQKVLDQRRPG